MCPKNMLFLWALCVCLPPRLASEPQPCPTSARNFSSVLDSLECYNDYSSHIRCSWRESAEMHSQGPLSLFHLDEEENSESQCLPYRAHVPLPGGLLAVHCQYNTTVFRIFVKDLFFFKTPHSARLSKTIPLAQLVRVRPPHSLSQRPVEGGGTELHWQSSYPPSSPLYPTLNYQLNYRQRGQDWMVQRVKGKDFQFKPGTLVPGCWYEARVRSRGGKGPWSEWSPLMEWKTGEDPLPGPYNLQCVFDGEAAVTCSWEVKTDLAQFISYNFSYRTSRTAPVQWCCAGPPVSVDPSVCGSAALRFSCSFLVSHLEQLQVDLTPSYNPIEFRACKNIRPNPPAHMNVQEKGENWVLSWNAPKSPRPPKIFFQVRYWRKGVPDQVTDHNTTVGAQSHFLHRSALQASTEYVARVRAVVSTEGMYSGHPSDWTEPVHWTTHKAPWSISTILYLIIGVCVALLCLLLYCAFPACRRKVKVWDMSVPSPWKSKVMEEMMKKSKSDCLAHQKETERAAVSQIQVLERFWPAPCSPLLSKECGQPMWLTATEEDEAYKRVSGQAWSSTTSLRRMSDGQLRRDASCLSLTEPYIMCPACSRPQSGVAVDQACGEDSDGASTPPSPTPQEALLESGGEYMPLPLAKFSLSQDTSQKWLKAELEVQDGYIDNHHLLLGPPESGTVLQSVLEPFSVDSCSYAPLPQRAHSGLNCCLFPKLGTTNKGAAAPCLTPAEYTSEEQAGKSNGTLKDMDITQDHIFLKPSHA